MQYSSQETTVAINGSNTHSPSGRKTTDYNPRLILSVATLVALGTLCASPLVAAELGAGQYLGAVWTDHFGLVLAVAVVFLVMATLIVALMLQNHRRELAELAARESEARLHLLLDQAPDAILVHDLDLDRFIEANASAERLFGCSRNELLRGGPLRFYEPRQPDGESPQLTVSEHVERAMSGESVRFDRVLRSFDGRELYCEVRLDRFPDAGRRLLRASYSDITDFQKAQMKLKRRKAELLGILDNSPGLIYMKDLEGRYMFANRCWTSVTGISEEQARGRLDSDLFPEQPALQFMANDALARESADAVEVEEYLELADGLHVFRSIRVAIKNAAGENYAICGISTDVTHRKKTELALQESERRLKALFDGAPVGMCRVNLDGTLLQANPALAAMHGYLSAEQMIELTGSGATRWIDTSLFDGIVAKAKESEGNYVRQEIELIRRDGGCVDAIMAVMLSSDPETSLPALVCFIQDITGLKKLEKQLIQSHKMESIGRLAGGIAHDFNNMLCIIQGAADLAKKKVATEDPLRQYLDQITKAAKRSSEITRQLLAFSRKGVIAPKPVNLNSLVIEAEEMLARLISEEIRFTFLPGTTLWTVMLDPAQAVQVLMNLSLNARDAMPSGGDLVIETKNVTFCQDSAPSQLDMKPGDYVMLSVRDSGHGMDQATLEHVFEPFFTTKGAGQGTGLGLATVYGIVNQNNGYIDVQSEPGKGTIFTIFLPRLATESAQKQANAAPTLRGNGIILLVEDEEMLLQTTTQTLEEMGYCVIPAQSPHVAISICSDKTQRIDLVLTDVVMPEMNGREMVEKLRALRADLKVLFMSGYTADIVWQRGVQESDAHYLQKPFTAQQLNDKICQAL